MKFAVKLIAAIVFSVIANETIAQEKTPARLKPSEWLVQPGWTLPSKVNRTGSDVIGLSSPGFGMLNLGYARGWWIHPSVAIGGAMSFGAMPFSAKTDITGSSLFYNKWHPVDRYTDHGIFVGLGARGWYSPPGSRLSIGLQPYVRLTAAGSNRVIGGNGGMNDTLYRQHSSGPIGPYFGTQLDANYKVVDSERGYFTIGLFVDHVFNPGEVSFNIAPNTVEASSGTITFRQSAFGVRLAFGIPK